MKGFSFVHLKRTWDLIGLSDEKQNKRLLRIGKACLLDCMKFIKNTEIIEMKERLGYSGTSIVVNGEYICGSLFRKLKKTWVQLRLSNKTQCREDLVIVMDDLDFVEKKCVQLGLSDEEQNAVLPDNTLGTIKDLIKDKKGTLNKLKKQKKARMKDFSYVLTQIYNIAGVLNLDDDVPAIDEFDLSQKELERCQSHLQKLKNDKEVRLQKVSDYVRSVRDLCAVGMDIAEIYPSLNCDQSKSISDATLAWLDYRGCTSSKN